MEQHATLVTGAASVIGRAIAARLAADVSLLGPDGRACAGAPVALDLGWTAR